ncbi:MAG TPA: DoxX family membrane protein [Gemmatimonadales bacterium]|nr:DoxX family membrane protein [Gemmatimonadales bacterium]
MSAGPAPVGPAFGRVPRWTLLLLRLYLGAAFLRAAANKIGASWNPWPGWMAGFIHTQLPHTVPLYRGFLADVVIPHAGFFAPAVACAEVAVGCCLILGLATRAAAIAGAVLTLNYLLMKGGPFLLPNNDPVFILGGIALCVGAAGRAYGLDYLLQRRFPHVPLW